MPDTGSVDPLVESPNTIARARSAWTLRSVSNARRYIPGEILDRLAYPLKTISQPAFTPGYGIHKNINCYQQHQALEFHWGQLFNYLIGMCAVGVPDGRNCPQ